MAASLTNAKVSGIKSSIFSPFSILDLNSTVLAGKSSLGISLILASYWLIFLTTCFNLSSSEISKTSTIIKQTAKPSIAFISTLFILIFIEEVDSVKSFNKCFLSSNVIFNLTKNEDCLVVSHSTSINLSLTFSNLTFLQLFLCIVTPFPLVI